MNDLPAFIPNAKIRMYADDTNLGQRTDDVNDINQQLIPDFRKLCEWLEINKVKSEFMKTEFLLFGNQSQLRNFDDLVGIRIKGSVIRRANSTKYLGTISDEGLKWDKHVSYISSKILRNIGVIKRVRTFFPKKHWILFIRPLWSHISDTAILSGEGVIKHSLTSYSSCRTELLVL